MYESIAELKGQVSEMEREMGKAKEEQALGLSVSYVPYSTVYACM